MTVASLNTDVRSVKLKPIFQHPPVQQWKEELDFLQLEIVFYKRLLRMGLQNGQASKKQLLFTLLEAFSKYEDVFLPEIRNDIQAFSTRSIGQNNAVFACQQKMEQHNLMLRDMKAKTFLLATEFQKITLW